MDNERSLNQRVRGSSPWRVIDLPSSDRSDQGDLIQHLETNDVRRMTLVDWAMAPKWLTMLDGARLTGYSVTTLHSLIESGAVEAKEDDGQVLIQTQSLREFSELVHELRTND